MSQALHDYFTQHGEKALAGMKQALLAQNFYNRLLPRLIAGEDLSDEMPVIAKLGQKGTIKVAKAALAENQARMQAVWQLPPKLRKLGEQEIKMNTEPYELLPRVQMIYRYKCSAGQVVVHVQTMGENVSVTWKTERNKMVAAMCLQQLEKDLAFALLANQ